MKLTAATRNRKEAGREGDEVRPSPSRKETAVKYTVKEVTMTDENWQYLIVNDNRLKKYYMLHFKDIFNQTHFRLSLYLFLYLYQ